MKKYILFITSAIIITVGIIFIYSKFIYSKPAEDPSEQTVHNESVETTKTTNVRASRDIEPQAHKEAFVGPEDIPQQDESDAMKNFPFESEEETIQKLK